jgi:hypothetical protein
VPLGRGLRSGLGSALLFFCALPLAVAKERTWLVAPLFFGIIVLNTGAAFIFCRETPLSEAIIEPRLIMAEPVAAKETARNIEWITCRACKGEIGVPTALREKLIACPGCGLGIRLSDSILFRPTATLAPAPAPNPSAPQSAVHRQPAKASVELLRYADVVLNWGIASIVLGWTILAPLLGLFYYLYVAEEAKKENTLVPGKATVGLALSLLFGVGQVAAMIAKLTH